MNTLRFLVWLVGLFVLILLGTAAYHAIVYYASEAEMMPQFLIPLNREEATSTVPAAPLFEQ